MQDNKRLFELLEAEQEPFLLEVYLLENGFSDSRIKSHTTICSPCSFACKKLASLITNYGCKVRRAGILRCIKALNWKYCTTTVLSCIFELGGKYKVPRLNKSSAYGDTQNGDHCSQSISSEGDSGQLSPLSVLQLNSSDDDDSTFCNLFEEESIASLSCLILPTETKELGSPQNRQLSDAHSVLLDYLTKLEGKLWGSIEGSSTPTITITRTTATTCDDKFLFAWQLEGLANISQLKHFDFIEANRSWSNFQIEISEIGVEIESIIFEEIKEEIISEMCYRCT